MEMEVRFPGGRAVEATFGGHVVRTDQPAEAGGDASAPTPFDLFLASMATCMGTYALAFCERRGLPTDGLRLTLEAHRDPSAGRVGRLEIRLHPPDGLPEKYRAAILRAMDQCAVKRHILEPPEFDLAVAAR